MKSVQLKIDRLSVASYPEKAKKILTKVNIFLFNLRLFIDKLYFDASFDKNSLSHFNQHILESHKEQQVKAYFKNI